MTISGGFIAGCILGGTTVAAAAAAKYEPEAVSYGFHAVLNLVQGKKDENEALNTKRIADKQTRLAKLLEAAKATK